MKKIKMNLQEILDKNRYSRRAFAIETGIRQTTINNYCNNNYKHIVKEHVEIICNFFKCDLDDLLKLESN